MNIQDETFPHDGLQFSLNCYATQKAITSTITPPPTNENTSASSSSSSSDQQILSTESMNTRSPLDVSVKTSSSDPIGLAVQKQNIDGEKYDEGFQCNRQPNSISYHEIHNKYTMRRYQHVESKVGQYIANIRAEDQRRRANFQSHKSMPISIVQQEPDQLEDRETSSLRQGTIDFNVHNGSNGTNRSESSDDALNSADYIDKSTYNQLVDEKEYLETRLKEKSSENFRLRRNVDYLRIELTSCQDRLKRMSNSSINSNFSNYSSVMGYSHWGIEAFVERRQHKKITETRSTQTDDPAFVLTTPILTSLKVTCNVIRQRSNLNSSARDFMRRKNFNSPDDGFGSSEMHSRKSKNCKIQTESLSSSDVPSESSTSLSRSPPPATPVMLNDSDNSIIDIDAADHIRTKVFVNRTSTQSIKRHISLSQRFKRLIRRCTRCVDPNNHTPENQCERFDNAASIVSTAL